MSVGPPGDIVASRVLATFLSIVSSRPAPELVDLGPAIGKNIAFLGERIGCKIHVEDLYAELDRHAEHGTLDGLSEMLRDRFAGCTIVEGDPTQPGPWMDQAAACDGIINLAGEGVFNRRWNDEFKAQLRDSRLRS